jgi:predicted Zn-dependent protease
MPSPTAYELYRSGVDLLEQGDTHAAALPLARARDLEPRTAMVREALGRALFSSQRYREAADEFAVLVELEPLNDYGQFCLGRALQLQGLHAEARPPLTLAALLQPARRDYAMYRDRTIAALSEGPAPADAREDEDAQVAPAKDAPRPRRSGEGPWGAPGVEPDAGAAAADDDVPGTDGA